MANPRTIARLEARIQERAAHCLQFEIRDPRAGFITVTGVELSADLTSGKIRWSVLGGPSDRSKAEHMLEHAAGFIQRQIARVLDIRRIPHLRWIYDERLENAQALQTLIREARDRDREINPALALEDEASLAAEPRASDEESEEDSLEGDDELEDDDLDEDEGAWAEPGASDGIDEATGDHDAGGNAHEAQGDR